MAEQQAPSNASRPLRADAVRNRSRILDAARETFAELGTEASLEEVARRADVGIGTLYRHFPTRASLIEHVYRDLVDELCATAPALLKTHTPIAALEAWVLSFTSYVGQKRGMVASLRAALGDEPTTIFADSHVKLATATTLLLDAARGEGAIRGDIDPMDLLRTVSGVCMAAGGPGVSGAGTGDPEETAERTRRMLGLILDGMRYGAPA